jgi:hypothetical protein
MRLDNSPQLLFVDLVASLFYEWFRFHMNSVRDIDELLISEKDLNVKVVNEYPDWYYSICNMYTHPLDMSTAVLMILRNRQNSVTITDG